MKHKHRGRSSRRASGREKRILTAIIAVLALIMAALALYAVHWYINLGRIRTDAARYRGMYEARPTQTPAADIPAGTAPPTEAPTASSTAAPTEAPTAEPTALHISIPTASPTPSEAPTAEPTALRIAIPTASPTPSEAPAAEPTPVPTEVPTEEPTHVPADIPTEHSVAPTAALPASNLKLPMLEDMPVAEDEPIPTPDAGTLVYALPTPPPVQDSFAELLAHNPDTVGFLNVDGLIELPVVHRENDNEYYLDHTFEGDHAEEGALFLDGLNRLVPEDDCLIVYGHNMKNKTMFGRLDAYGDVNYLRQHSVIHFDTIYENRAYVAFAAFSASMEPGNRRYFNVRQFIFDETEFDKFVLKLQSRSMYRIPVDIRYGDHLLLLVTCDYTNDEGRFILALRQLRPDESEANLWAQAMQAEVK